MKENLYDYMIGFAREIEWASERSRKKFKSVFTTFCLVHGIQAGTANADRILKRVYSVLREKEPSLNWNTVKKYLSESI